MSQRPKRPRRTPKQALEILDRHKEEFRKSDEVRKNEEARWNREIAMLERRIPETANYLQLPGGQDAIAVRISYSVTEEAELVRILQHCGSDPDAVYELIEKVTANPLITKDWLKENPGKFAINDFLEVLMGWLETRKARRVEIAARLAEVASFREM
jgi:hypothetical protein